MSHRDVLRQLHDEHDGLTAALVVDTARDPNNELHGHFEWDDTVAGERYRLAQAQGLIRSFKVTYRDDKRSIRQVRAYANVALPEGNVYRATEVVLSNEFTHALLLQGLERDIKALRRKYGHLDEFARILAQEAGGNAA